MCPIAIKRRQQFVHFIRQRRFLLLNFVLEVIHLFSYAVEELTYDLRDDDIAVTIVELRQTHVSRPDRPRLTFFVQKTVHL